MLGIPRSQVDSFLEPNPLAKHSLKKQTCLKTTKMFKLPYFLQANKIIIYSGCRWKVMKEKCHFQRGVLQYENATMPLSSLGIHTSH